MAIFDNLQYDYRPSWSPGASGCARPRSMPAHGQERRPKSRQSSSACGERTPNYAGLTRF
jgi:hypothetical protein